MRYALVLAAAALLAPPAVRAADPPITFQTQTASRVLGDLRAAADLVGGEPAVKGLNDAIREKLGDKGFAGLDLDRPLVGYVVLAPKPADIVAVVAIPFTVEKDFLALCERFNGSAPKDLGGGVYQLPPLNPEYKAHMRFSDGYAYIAYGLKPEPALAPKALVPALKLIDPAEQAAVAATFHFDRLTPAVKFAIPAYVEEVKKELGLDLGAGGLGFMERLIVKEALPELEKMAKRYLLLLGGADTATVKLKLDVPTADFVVEATLTPKPDTALAKEIAARKPTANLFGGLLTPDTVAGFKTRLPFYNDELKAAGTKALKEAQAETANNLPPTVKALSDELFKGLARTVKTGEADIVGGVRGPDKNGDFAAVLAVAFDDPAALEKEFKKFVEKEAPADEQAKFKWDADKAGKVAIHTYKIGDGRTWLEFFGKPFGGGKCLVAYAFAPKGVFVVVGPDAVASLKDALAVKPAAAPVLDIVLNPARMQKLLDQTAGPGGPTNVEQLLGKEDRLISAASLTVEGGKELTTRFTLNLRLLPKALVAGVGGTKSVEEVRPIPNEKR